MIFWECSQFGGFCAQLLVGFISVFVEIIIGRSRCLTEGFFGLSWSHSLSICTWYFMLEELCDFVGDIFSLFLGF